MLVDLYVILVDVILVDVEQREDEITNPLLCCVMQTLCRWVRMLSDVREAMDHSEVVAMVVANIKAGALALSKAILRRTPGHSDVAASDGCGVRLPVSVCLSSCSLFVAIIGSLSIVYICYNVQASIDPDVQPGNLTDCQGHESSRGGTG